MNLYGARVESIYTELSKRPTHNVLVSLVLKGVDAIKPRGLVRFERENGSFNIIKREKDIKKVMVLILNGYPEKRISLTFRVEDKWSILKRLV